MHNLLAFFTRYHHWMLFLMLELVSVMLLFRYNSYQGSVWVSSANAVTGKVYEWRAGIEQFFQLNKRARQLAVENIDLEMRLRRANDELQKLKGDTLVADSTMQCVASNLHMLPAKVVNSTLNRPDNLITIDIGARDGVKTDMGVVSGMGLVGVVYMASDHYSVVMPVLNKHSRTSCAIRGSGYFGYLMWDGRSTTEAIMEDVPRHAVFKLGDWVETSGYSAIFPPGITVGQITGIGDSADGLSFRLRIKLSTDFGCLRDVFVITDDEFSEQLMLLMAARDSMSLAN